MEDDAEERGWPRRQADADDNLYGRCRGTVFGDADKKSSPRKGRSGDDDSDDAKEQGWPQLQADTDDNVYRR